MLLPLSQKGSTTRTFGTRFGDRVRRNLLSARSLRSDSQPAPHSAGQLRSLRGSLPSSSRERTECFPSSGPRPCHTCGRLSKKISFASARLQASMVLAMIRGQSSCQTRRLYLRPAIRCTAVEPATARMVCSLSARSARNNAPPATGLRFAAHQSERPLSARQDLGEFSSDRAAGAKDRCHRRHSTSRFRGVSITVIPNLRRSVKPPCKLETTHSCPYMSFTLG